MSIFANLICKALLEYKRVLKRHLSAAQAKLKITKLGLGRKVLQDDNDIMLYRKGQRALADINAWLEQQSDHSSWYSGVEEFRIHIHALLTDYRIVDSQVIHGPQKASSITIQALQILNLPLESLTSQVGALQHLGQQIADLGTTDQHDYYLNLLKKKRQQQPAIFLPLVEAFERHQHSPQLEEA